MIPLSRPLEAAKLKAADLGACPIDLVEGFNVEHCDFDTLCATFRCDECVAAPNAMGWCPEDEEDACDGGGWEEASWEIPF